MNANAMSAYDVATWIDHGGDWGSVASLIRHARDEAIDRLTAPMRLARVLFLATLPVMVSEPQLCWRRVDNPSQPAPGPMHALYARRSETWLLAAASGVPVTP